MLKISNNIMKITKGDTAKITVDLTNADGSKYIMKSGDTLTLTVRKTAKSEVLMSVTSTTNVLTLPHSETAKLIPGNCCFDIQLTTASGEVYTIVGLTDFSTNMVVWDEVTV